MGNNTIPAFLYSYLNYNKNMGIILRFIGRRIHKAATKAVEAAVITGAVVGAAAVAVAADDAAQKKKDEKAALIASKNFPVFQISIPQETNRKQRNIHKTLEPQIKELNKNAEEVYELLELLYQKKIQLLDCFVQYADILDKIEGLPENPEVKIRYKVKLLSFVELSNHIKGYSQSFRDDQSLKIHVAKRGFIKCRNKDNESMNRLFSLENKLNVIDVDTVTNVKETLKEIEKLHDDYETIYDYIVEDFDKLETCHKRYTKVIRKFEDKFKKTTRYDQLSKLVSSSYASTILILDLINTNFVEKDKVNSKALDAKMNRRMI